MSEDWIEAQVSTKVIFHLNALTVEELGTMHRRVLTRKQRIKLKRQRKPKQITSRKGRDSKEDHFMLSKIAVHLKTQMNHQMKKEPLNFCRWPRKSLKDSF